MNSQISQASNIALDWFVDQFSGFAFEKRKVYSEQDLQQYYQDCVEDWPTDYDQDYYSIWYIHQRSPCIDWTYVLEKFQEKMDDIYLKIIFS